MKNIIIVALGFVIIMSVIVGVKLDILNTDVVVRTEEVIEIVKEEDKYGNLDKMILEAQDTASVDIEAKLDVYRQELLKEIEDKIKAEYISDIEGTISTEDY